MKYPPELSDEQLEVLFSDIKDWQLINGSLLKLIRTDDEDTLLAQSVGVTLFPTLFPKDLFDEALSLRPIYNKLYTAIASDPAWLYQTLKALIEVDILSSALWSIYVEVSEEGYVQDLNLGVFRSDYMLHQSSCGSQLKQVEFNTISCAGGIHSNLSSKLHQHIQRTGGYESLSPESTSNTPTITPLALPPNHTTPTIAAGIVAAHKSYGAPKITDIVQTCVLFIVQDNNFNTADERPIEYALWDHSIPTYRLLWGHNILDHTSLTKSRELIYHPPNRSQPMEVSVVYYRAGFEAHEYDNVGRQARLQLEKSRAIKCPNILSHLTTFKKVQQELAVPGTLSSFLSPDEAFAIEKTFAPIHPLDESASGILARKMALDPKTARNYILKPSLEGGGHNIYGEDITKFLEGTRKESWNQYILMERIIPPRLNNFLVSQRGMYGGEVISELGVFGVCLWKVGDSGVEIQQDLEGAWSFKTKDASVDEMSVVKGYGCFDSPFLVDGEIINKCIG